ncbi:MAG: hypothetical protein RIC30_19260 [Marinoscillum sp.]|uniref:hypothetical protein n=1 Tax=Marinoscillum sp. TaxID=2024838 RepID=UPI00330031A7
MIQLLSLLFLAGLAYFLRSGAELRVFYWSGLAFRMLCGLALGWYYLIHLGAGDTTYFHEQATTLFQLSGDSFSEYIHSLLTAQHPVYMGEARNEFFIKILSILYLITGGNYWISGLYLSFAGFYGSWYLVSRIHQYHPAYVTAAIASFLFLPTAMFWSSGVLKDPLINGALCMLAGFCIRYWHHTANRLREYFLVGGGLLILFYLKFYLVAVTSMAMGILAWAKVLDALVPRKTFKLLFTLGGAILMGLLVTQVNKNLHFDQLPESVYNTHQVIYNDSEPDKTLHFPDLEPTYPSLIMHLPKGLIAGLFRPFIWEVNGPLIVGGLQNLFFLLLFFYSLFHAHRYRFTTLVLITVGFITILATFLPLVSPNLGSLERYKAAYQPFLLFILLIIPSKRFLS